MSTRETEGVVIARWLTRRRDDEPGHPDVVDLHPHREAALDHAAEHGGVVERLAHAVKVEAGSAGLRPCLRCPSGWLCALAEPEPAGTAALCPHCGATLTETALHADGEAR